MSRKRRMKLLQWWLLYLAVFIQLAAPLEADAEHSNYANEEYATGWSVQVDNDLFFPTARDQQYTGGMSFTLSGKRATDYWYSLDPILSTLNSWTGLSTLYTEGPHYLLHSVSFGVEAFTPANIRTQLPVYNDRPYANLMFLSNTQLAVNVEEQISYHSNFSLGVIGSELGENIQKELHRVLGNDVPQGWEHQISDGGELTAMYTVARKKLHLHYKSDAGLSYSIGSMLGASIGTTTEIGFGVGGRLGRITRPWWEFSPVFGDYINLGSPSVLRPHTDEHELFFWWGVIGRYRIYNAMLQGQFMESDVVYGADDLIPLITESALGITWEPVQQWTLSLSLRSRTSEFRNNTGLDTDWGSLTLSYSY